MSRKYHHAKSAGKGSVPRPINGDKYRENYDQIFKKEGIRFVIPKPIKITAEQWKAYGIQKQSWKPKAKR